MSDFSRVGARAGSLGSWFLDRKLGEGYKDTLDQSDWCLMFSCNQVWISLLHLPEPNGPGEKESCRSSVLVRPHLKVQREPLSAGVGPVRGLRRECPSCPLVCLYGNYPGDG